MGKRVMSGAVMKGTIHDSLRPGQMFVGMSDGTGCVMLDVIYDTYENYRMNRNSGRRPVSDPCRDYSQGLQSEVRDAQVEEGEP